LVCDDPIEYKELTRKSLVPIPQRLAIIDILTDQIGQRAFKGYHQKESLA
jgi:hypothetical protein